MKILWLTIDRSFKVAQHFGRFQKEVAKQAEVDFVVRSLEGLLPGKYCKLLLAGEKKVRPFDFSCKGYDFVFTDAFFAFACKDWEKITIPKGILFEDMHGPFVREHVRLALEYGTDLLFHRHLGFEKFHPEVLKCK